MRQTIAQCAIRLFDKNGFHGTGMREIGEAARCKMPTLYYHYNNKETLFDEVVRVAFEKMVTRLDGEIPSDLSLEEACIRRVIQKKNLDEDDKIVYRLAIKTWLGFEGCEGSRKKLLEWEQNRYSRNEKLYTEHISSPLWIKFLTRAVTGIIQRIILLEDTPTDAEIREEISMIFLVATQHTKLDKNI